MKTQTKQHGFTLMELMVALAVVAIMVVGFGTILTTSKNIVTSSQKMMRANSSAASIARIIRQDLRKVSKNGFLAYFYEDITHTPTNTTDAEWNDKYFLALTTAGVSPSVTSADIGSGTITIYRDKINEAPGRDDYFLLRQRWVLKNGKTGSDCWNLDFSSIQTLPLDFTSSPNYTSTGANIDSINELLGFLMGKSGSGYTGYSFTLRYPPQNITDINNLWQILSANCVGDNNSDNTGEGLIIQWWDSSGIYAMNPGTAGWSIVPAIWAKGRFFYDDNLDNVFVEDTTNSEWPPMIRILIKMKSDSLEANVAEETSNVFEIIATVGP